MTYSALVPGFTTTLLWFIGVSLLIAVPAFLQLLKEGATAMLGKGGAAGASLLIGATIGALVAGAVYLFYVQPTNAATVRHNVEQKYDVSVESAHAKGDSTYDAKITTPDNQARHVEILIDSSGMPTIISADELEPMTLER